MTSIGDAPFFRLEGQNSFDANDGARGPWAADACHAGPVAGVIARALERAVPEKQLSRLTVNVVRPVPTAGFTIRESVERKGRTLTLTRATLVDRNDRPCCDASGVHIAVHNFTGIPTADSRAPSFDDRVPGPFPILKAVHDLPCFPHAVEVAYPPGENIEPGPTTLWMKTPALLDGEEMTPFQRLCPLADCGNGISRNAAPTEMLFMNVDLTLIMHRAPVGDWVASSAASFWESMGVGLAQATLFDPHGQVGVASQTLVVAPRA